MASGCAQVTTIGICAGPGGGGQGIRTLDGCNPIAVFKTAALGHYASPPDQQISALALVRTEPGLDATTSFARYGSAVSARPSTHANYSGIIARVANTISASDPVAKVAVSAIHAGDVAGLSRLLADHPSLATARLGADVDKPDGEGPLARCCTSSRIGRVAIRMVRRP